ncbi:unnamed protein product, partial [Rotaria sp. Silwood2]
GERNISFLGHHYVPYSLNLTLIDNYVI